MDAAQRLTDLLRSIDGRGYKAFKALKGEWRFPDFLLVVDHVQGDPFAHPSRLTVHLDPSTAGLSAEALRGRSRRVGTSAYLADSFAQSAQAVSRPRGSGKSGEIAMVGPGQEVLRQTAVKVDESGSVEARFTVGLPADGRRVSGDQTRQMLVESVPELVHQTLMLDGKDQTSLVEWATTNEDAEALRTELAAHDLVAFIADGAILPRRTGVDDRPLADDEAVRFESPPTLRVVLDTPNSGPVSGMGVGRGVTLIVGGGYHGKSTVLRALERGVYNHRPGDGRERAVTDANAVKVRAEDGRSVAHVDISPFVNNLPQGKDTKGFSTANASGSTSQAAAIMEAVEAGASSLLVDEDTSATNFMIRDRRMQALVPRESEPITPFVDRIRQIFDRWNISSVLVLGGSGDYLEMADTVIAMKDFLPSDVTDRAAEVASSHPTGRTAEAPEPLGDRPARTPDPGSLDARRGKYTASTRLLGPSTIEFGTGRIDLAAVEQIVSMPQTRGIAQALLLAHARLIDGRSSIPELLDRLDALVDRDLDELDERRAGDLASFRRFEFAAALNRIRELRMMGPD